MTDINRIVVFAPNWLGDAVMAVPSVEAIRAQFPSSTLAVAARTQLAALYEMVTGVDEVVCLGRAGRFGGWLAALRDARRLRGRRFDVAILLPNSFRSAWIARRAGIAERWGYATDGRATLLTRAVARVRGVHQVEYYQRLLEGLEIARRSDGPEVRPSTRAGRGERVEPRKSEGLGIPAAAREWARTMLSAAGWKPGEPLVGMAPGAAYGTAKQWPPERFAELAKELALGPQPVRTVLVGSSADAAACAQIAETATGDLVQYPGKLDQVQSLRGKLRQIPAGKLDQVPNPAQIAKTAHLHPVLNLCGQTDLHRLAAVIAECRTFVSNDSGAMHLAAAVGVPVVAIFGSTNEKETAPLPLGTGASDHAIVATDVTCRPCMLRECPLENHPCMTGIDVARVKAEVIERIRAVDGRP